MEISEVRDKINQVDEKLLDLFTERMALAEQVGEYKSKNGLPLTDRAREREILAWAGQKSGELEPYAHQLFSTLFELSKARQGQLLDTPSKVRELVEKALLSADEVFPRTGTVACQGVEGANSQQACDKLLPRGNIMYFKTFEAVFDAVESGLCKYGVLPIENSSYGSVRSVYDLLQRKHFSIVRATSLQIRHELLAKPGTELGRIRRIYSHEQAIGQCSRFLAELKNVEVIPCDNTAMAAMQVSESDDRHSAAIASHRCAQLYGLESLRAGIEDTDNNYTQFICIARDPVIYAGADRISLIIACGNRPGALGGILAKIAAHGVNMSKLESCPVTGRSFEFMFFLELEASVREPGILPMLCELERDCENFIFLGNYSRV